MNDKPNPHISNSLLARELLGELTDLVDDILSNRPHENSLDTAKTTAQELIEALEAAQRALYVQQALKSKST